MDQEALGRLGRFPFSRHHHDHLRTLYDGKRRFVPQPYLLLSYRQPLNPENEDGSEVSGDGQAAFKELYNSNNKVTDEVTRATMEETLDTLMERGEHPDDDFCYLPKRWASSFCPLLEGYLHQWVYRQLQGRHDDTGTRRSTSIKCVYHATHVS